MSKKRSWLGLIKRLFFPEVHHQHQHKCKRRRWLFGRLQRTKGLPSPAVEVVQPEQPVTVEEKLDHADGRQNKCEENVPDSSPKCKREVPMCTDDVTDEEKMVSFNAQDENHLQIFAAIQIQTAFRGFLARKALRALKGFVILQAVIRGHAVRRQAVTTLKCLQTIVSIQSEMCRRREMIQGRFRDVQFLDDRDQKPKTIQISRDRRLDGRLLSKDEEIDFLLRKKEAFLRKQRLTAFSFNHRNSADSDDRNTEGRLRYWLEQYISDQNHKKEDNTGGKSLKMRNMADLSNNNSISVPRRSFQNHQKKNSYAEDQLQQSSPTNLPAYMAATKSAKAKTRSLSTPRLRPVQFDAYSDGDSPYKHKVSPMSSMNSEVTSSTFGKVSSKSCYSSSQQKSPRLRSVPGPVRSIRNLSNVRLDFKDVPLNRG